MVAARMAKTQIPTEEAELLTNEYKKIRGKKGRFKVKKIGSIMFFPVHKHHKLLQLCFKLTREYVDPYNFYPKLFRHYAIFSKIKDQKAV